MLFDKCKHCKAEVQRGARAVAQLAMGQVMEMTCPNCKQVTTIWPGTPPITYDKKVQP